MSQYSPAQLDALARERGFPDFASWRAWDKNYRSPVKGKGQAAAPKNWLQNLIDQIPIHPSYLLNKAADAMRQE